jgi:hypothetical protein
MELTITGDLAKQILSASKKDSRLAEQLASQFLTSIDPHAMAAFLLTREVAVSLLADRLRRNPVATIKSLQKLPGRGRRPVGRKKAAAAGTPTRGRKRRRRLTAADVEALKGQVRSFLSKNGWSTRKQLNQAVDLGTQAIYRRIMLELQQAGEVVSKGEKSKAVYGLKKGRTRKTGKAKKKK